MNKNERMDTQTETPIVQVKLRQLNRILDTVDALNARLPAPRCLLAVLYGCIFFTLAFLAAPPEWGLWRAIIATAVGLPMRKVLEKHGPGHTSWWARLSAQLRQYTPVDQKGLTKLRKHLSTHGSRGKQYALRQVVDWVRTETDAVVTHDR